MAVGVEQKKYLKIYFSMVIDRYLRRIVRRACFSDRIDDDWNKRMTLRRRQEVHHRVDATEESIGAKRQCDGHGSES
jgi:hypothetical protein